MIPEGEAEPLSPQFQSCSPETLCWGKGTGCHPPGSPLPAGWACETGAPSGQQAEAQVICHSQHRVSRPPLAFATAWGSIAELCGARREQCLSFTRFSLC